MDLVPLIFALVISLPTGMTQPLDRRRAVSGSNTNTINSMAPRNEDGDHRFAIPEASVQNLPNKKPFKGDRVGVTQLKTIPVDANFYARMDQIFRRNLMKYLQRIFKQAGNFGGYRQTVESYLPITALQRSRSEFERRKQMAQDRFRNARNNVSYGYKRDQGPLNSRAVSFTSQNPVPERQVEKLSSVSHTGYWTEGQQSSSNSNSNPSSQQKSGAMSANGPEQEVEHQENEQPGASSLPSGAKSSSNYGGGVSNAGSGQALGATNGQTDEVEHQASEHSATASSTRTSKNPSDNKANSPELQKQRPQVTPIKIQGQEVERQESGSLTPSQRSHNSPSRVASTLSPPSHTQRPTSTSNANKSTWESQASNSKGTSRSTTNESFGNSVRSATTATMQQKQRNENKHYNAHHDYHYERVERLNRTLRILSRLGLSHVIPFITFQFIHNHPYGLPLPHLPFLLDPEYIVHPDNSD